jgi:hypothetical protein
MTQHRCSAREFAAEDASQKQIFMGGSLDVPSIPLTAVTVATAYLGRAATGHTVPQVSSILGHTRFA